MRQSAIKAALHRIRCWYEENVDPPPTPDFLNWGRPATAGDLSDIESLLGHELLPEIRDCYRTYNGTRKCWIFPQGYLMELSEVQVTWKYLSDASRSGVFDDSVARPDPGIGTTWWSASWIPVVHNGGGDFCCVDLSPTSHGRHGQVIRFEHEFGPSSVLAGSMREWFENLADDLDARRFRFDFEEGSIVPA